jgi:hypothetical protein
MSQNPIKIDLANSFITIGKKWSTYIDIDSVVERISQNDADAAIAFGILFGMLGGAAGVIAGGGLGAIIDDSKVGSRTVEGNYYRQSFNPTFIYPENSGAGLAFYYLSTEDFDCETLTLSVPIVDLNSNNISNAEITFKPANFKTIREDKK